MAKTKSTSKARKQPPRKPVTKGARPRPAAAAKRGRLAKPQKAVALLPAVEAAFPIGPAPAKFVRPEKLKDLRDKLLRLRERMTGQINFLAADNLNRTPHDNEINFRSEEQGTDNFDRDFALNRVSLEQDIVFEIEEALNRLRLGTYGACESCGGGIEKARLDVLPYSRMCVGCQSRAESARKGLRAFDGPALFPNADKPAAETGDDE